MSALRSLIVAASLALAIAVAPASAADTGRITGVVHNESDGRPQAKAKVSLLHLRQGQEKPDTTTVTTDANGRYAFDDLPTGPEHVYALDVVHDGGLFASGTIQMPSRTAQPPVVETDVKVWDTTDDPNAILLRRNDAFLSLQDDSVAVVDSYRVVNTSDLAYIGRGGVGAETTLGFPLPPRAADGGVVIVNEPRIDIPDLRATEFGFGLTVAIPPGQTDLVFSYSVAGDGGSFDLTKTALYPILDASVFAQPPLEVRSNRLTEIEEPVDVGGETYKEYRANEDIDAGDPIQVLAVAEAGMSPWLVVGATILFGLIALALALGLILRRSSARRTSPRRDSAPAADRDSLVLAIAELDLRYRDGDLDEADWRAQRERLKARVEERAPEPTS